MNKAKELNLNVGLTFERPAAQQTRVQLFGHVTLVQAYAASYPGYTGCYALVALRDTPGKTIAVMAADTKVQTLLETALATGDLVYFTGSKLANPPTPGGGAWNVEVYSTDNVCLYNFA